MALTRVDVAETKPAAKKDSHPSFQFPGDIVARFNRAKALAEDAAAKANEARAKILTLAIEKLFAHNCDRPTATIKTIELIDATGSSARLTSQSKYGAADPESVEQLFENLNSKYPDAQVDINNFVQESVVASFDSKVFNVGEGGRFSKEIYDQYAAAIDKVTASLIANKKLPSGTPSPLKTTKKVIPLDNFDETRWVYFPDPKDHTSILAVLPNTITLTPLVTKEEVPVLPEPAAKVNEARAKILNLAIETADDAVETQSRTKNRKTVRR